MSGIEPMASAATAHVTTETTSTSAPFEMSWRKETTPLEALDRTLYAMADELSGTVSEADGGWSLMVHPRAASADLQALQHRIRQVVTDQTLRVRIAERTNPVRNLVFALAFSRSGLVSESDQPGPEATLRS